MDKSKTIFIVVVLMVTVTTLTFFWEKSEGGYKVNTHSGQQTKGVASSRASIENIAEKRPSEEESTLLEANEADQGQEPPKETEKKLESIIIEARTIPSNVASAYDELSELASSGDLDAAVTLAKALQYCSVQPRTQEEFEQVLADALSEPTNVIQATFEQCKGVSDDQLAKSIELLEMAATEGDIEAQVELLSAAPLHLTSYDENYVLTDDEEKDYLAKLNKRKLEFADKAVKAGNLDAALSLALSYSSDSHQSPAEKNNQKALEYLLIAIELDPLDSMGAGEMYEFITLQTPVYIADQAKINAATYFAENLQGKPTSTLKYMDYGYE